MNTLHIRNFRSIVDSGEIPINRINILLGKNSSGKSSFVRIFPMFKQTISHHHRGPLLWFDEFYDLGKFETALSRHAEGEKEIVLGLKLNKPKPEPDCKTERCDDCALINPEPNLFLNDSKSYGLDIHLSCNDKGETVYKKLVLTFERYVVELQPNSDDDFISVGINGEKFFQKSLKWSFRDICLLPKLLAADNSKLDKTQEKLTKLFRGISAFGDRHVQEFHNIGGIHLDEVLSVWKKKQKNPIVSAVLSRIEANPADAKDILSFVIFINLADCLRVVNNSVCSYFSDSFYIAPIRYNYGRFMRNKEQSVNVIDPIGKNVMEYIEDMSGDDFKSYKEFIGRSFKATFFVDGKDNKSIKVLKDGEEDNLVDVGSGFAQVLPIATMLWDLVNRRGNYCSIPYTVAIEQPELHLHPSMQAEFAEMVMNVMEKSMEKKNNLNLIIETHSPIILNRIGRMLRNKDVATHVTDKDISVYLFEKEKGITHIQTTKFNEDGRIENWPIGFLD